MLMAVLLLFSCIDETCTIKTSQLDLQSCLVMSDMDENVRCIPIMEK